MSSQRAVAVLPFRALVVYERSLQAGAFLLPLLWWGGLEDGFARPKLWLLAAMNGILALHCVAAGSRAMPRGLSAPARAGEASLLAWPAVLALAAIFGRYVSLEALLLALLPLPLAWALWEGLVPARGIRAAIQWGSTVESAVALLQSARLDPFRLFWHPDLAGSPRLRVYGTMGNPDFVAAWLCATLPLHAGAFSEHSRSWRVAAFALQVAAILATGSRLFLIALPVTAAAFLAGRRRAAGYATVLLPLAAIALLWLSPARPLSTTVEGRLYLARIALRDWQQTPVLGYGPGSFRLLFGTWQADWIREHPISPAAAQFAGPVDHAHNDYVEFLSEYGPAGLAVFLILPGGLLWRARGARPRRSSASTPAGSGEIPGTWRNGVLAGVAILLAVALVDFPFHRPPEWALYWVFLGMLGSGRSTPLPREITTTTAIDKERETHADYIESDPARGGGRPGRSGPGARGGLQVP